MLRAIGGNTLFTVLLARQLVASDIGLETLSRDLFAQEEKVRLVHGESAYKLIQREWLKTICLCAPDVWKSPASRMRTRADCTSRWLRAKDEGGIAFFSNP